MPNPNIIKKVLSQRGSSGPSYDPDAVAFFAACSTQPSAAKKLLISNTFVDLKTGGGFNNLAQHDCLYGLAAEYQDNSRINWAAPAAFPITEVSSPTWTQYQGYTGGSGWLNPGFVPSTNGVHFLKNDCCIWVYSRSNTNVAYFDIGCFDGTNFCQLSSREGGKLYGSLNDLAAGNITVADSLGLTLIRRTSSSTIEVWKRGVLIGSYSISSTAIVTVAPYILARNVGGTGLNKSSRQIAFAGFGSSSINPALLNNSIETIYMTGLGTNV